MWRIGLILCCLPVLAHADLSQGGKTIECFCTDRNGARIELGQMICMQVDGRMFTAQCQMSQNVPMWREVTNGCLSSHVQTGPAPLTALN